MDNIIIEWLNNSNNNNNIDSNDDLTLIECILVISINGILIDHNYLIEFCNQFIKYNGCDENDDRETTINNNNKRKNNSNHDSNDSNWYYGLSAQQFQIINNNIKSINNIIGNDKQSVITTTIVNNNNNNEHFNSNKIKFESSINIISENNKRILKRQQQQQAAQQQCNNNNNKSLKLNQQQTISNSSSNSGDIRKKIKSCNCNNNDNDGGGKIDKVFFKVWRHIVIRNEILYHLRIYGIHLNKRIRIQMCDLPKYKYTSYLNQLELQGNHRDEDQEEFDYDADILIANSLPTSLTEIYSDGNDIELHGTSGDEEEGQEFDGDADILIANSLPTSLTEIYFYGNHIELQVNSIPNSVTSVVFEMEINSFQFIKGILPDSITSLKFGFGCEFNQELSLEWLPSSLLALDIGYSFQQSIKRNQLPQSLTKLVLGKLYGGYIEAGSIPNSVCNLDCVYSGNRLLSNTSFDISTKRIEFKDFFDQIIKPGDISHNVVSIKFGNHFKSEIMSGSLPLLLESLYLNRYDGAFNMANELSNLTSINMGQFNQPLTPNIFPQSITSIKLPVFDQPIPEGYFYNLSNLKSLKFGVFNEFLPAKTLPDSLTYLKFRQYKRTFNSNVFPNSLLTLTMGSFDFKVEVGKLPHSITKLVLDTEYPIPVGSLPHNLKSLYLTCDTFHQDLSLDGIIPPSLECIYINECNSTLLQCMNDRFIYKYIKFMDMD